MNVEPEISCENKRGEFSVTHKVGNVGIYVLLKFESKIDREINHFNYNSKHYDKCKFAFILILFF